jgi:hypothetical protein
MIMNTVSKVDICYKRLKEQDVLHDNKIE